MAIPWIPILTTGASLLGSLLGNNDRTNQTENSTTTGTTAGTSKTAMNATTTQNQTQTQNSNQSSSQASTQDTQQVSTEQQAGNISRLDSNTLDMLTQRVQQGLGGSSGLDSIRRRLAEIDGSAPAFDSKAYVDSIMMGARSDVAGQVESATGNVQGRVGATGKSNSAAALLEAKIKNQAAGTLAGIQGDAMGKAAELSRVEQESRTGQITNLAAQTENGSQALLNALLQARETQTTQGSATQNQQTVGNQTGTTTGQTSTTAQSSENVSQNQTQVTAETQASKTQGSVNQNSSSINWGDMFTNLGKILSTSF